MQFTPQHNPITDRIKVITQQWLSFSENEQARICRWCVASDEVSMIEAFVKVENANEAQTEDYFIKFESPFENAADYTKVLSQRLQEEREILTNQLSPEEFAIINGTPSGIKIKNTSTSFGSQLQQLHDELITFKGLLVAVLFPDENHDPDGMVQWLRKELDKSIPEHIRFMVLDLNTRPFLEPLASEYARQMVTVIPKLDMDGAMLEIAGAGDPNDPGVRFRKLLVEMNQHANKGNLSDMERCGEAAAAIAVREGWSDLQINVYFCMAGGYVRAQLVEQAISTYEKAENIGSALWKDGNELAGRLLVITLLSKGSVYFGERDYKTAIETYQAGIEPATDLEDNLGLLELWRMTGTSHEMLDQSKGAWEAFQEALTAGSNLDPEMRSSSTLPYVGSSLLRLVDTLNMPKEENSIEQQMIELCGKDWKSKIVTTSP